MAEAAPSGYRELIRALAGSRQALEADQGAAYQWRDGQLAAARAAVERAQEVVRDAADQVETARAMVERVDSESALLWRALGARLGPAGARRLGAPPAPASAVADPDAEPLVLLRRVRAALDAVPARRARPLWLTAAGLLLLLAVVSGGLFLLIARFG